MKTIAELYIPDRSLHGKAIQVAASFEGQPVESDVLISKRGQIHIQIQQVITGVDTAADSGIVKTFEVLVEEVDVFFHFFGGYDKAKVLIDGDGFGRLYITGIILIKEGLKGCGQIFYGELSDDGPVEFIADNGNGLVVVDDAGFEGQGVEGDAPTVLEDRRIIDAGMAKEIVDVIAGKITFEFPVELYLRAGEVQLTKVCFCYLRLKIEFGLLLAEVNEAVEMNGQVGIIGDELTIELLFCNGSVDLYLLVGIVIEFNAIDSPVEGGIQRTSFQSGAIDLSLKSDAAEVVVVEEGTKLKAVC
jgi:hypothetical protein